MSINVTKISKYTTLLLLTILLVAYFFIKYTSKRSGYIFDTVGRSSITEVVSEPGTINADGITEIFSPTNGVISDIYVKNGDVIKSGQKLFKVISSATEEEKLAAKAAYLVAKATLDMDSANLFALQSAMFAAWDKHHNLAVDSKYQNEDKSPNYINRALPEYAIVNADWLAAESTYKSQQGVVAGDKAALSSSYVKYQSTLTSITASPLSGIADNIAFSSGKSVDIKDPIQNSSKPVLVIKNSNDLEAIISVGQTNIAKVAEGQSVIIKPDAYKDREYPGTVSRVDVMGNNIDGVVTYNVYVKVEKDPFLRAGMTFDSDIITKTLENVLTVPNSAIISEKGKKNVRIFENSKVKTLPIMTGVKGETHTEIISGLSENQEIITSLTNETAKRPGFMGL